MNVCYRVTDGIAHDLRFVADDYVALNGDVILVHGDTLPSLDSLSDAAAIAARDAPKTSQVQEQIAALTKAVKSMPGGDAAIAAQSALVDVLDADVKLKG